MNDNQRLFSPDQRFFILLGSFEIRMSHWITNASLWESSPKCMILQFGSSLWSTEQVTWHADSTYLTAKLRRYPGDAPIVLLNIYPDERLITHHTPTNTTSIKFEDLNQYLESYYQQHQRTSS